MKPMTDEQRNLAEENHDLVYAFLKANDLPEDQYYDVVIFGFLCAVQEYYENPGLKQYKFSTVAWKKMNRELYCHRKYLSSRKHAATTVSIHDTVSEDSTQRWEEVLHDPCDLLSVLQAEMVLHSLAVSPRDRRIIRMRLNGERMHDIAKAERLTFQDINDTLVHLQKLFTEALYL